MRDIARRIQTYRKELNLNPTSYISCVHLSGIEEEHLQNMIVLAPKLAILVRAHKIKFEDALNKNLIWKEYQIDEGMIKVAIED